MEWFQEDCVGRLNSQYVWIHEYIKQQFLQLLQAGRKNESKTN